MKSIIGRKMGMTTVFATDGTMYAVTVVEVLPNAVTQVKTKENDGYEAIQIGYEEKKECRINKCEKGIFAKAGVTPKYELRELTGDEMLGYKVGDLIDASLFQAGDIVDVIGTSKGKGFSGVIKRYHQKIGPKGHGSGCHRVIGSAGVSGTTSNRIAPGKRMPGHQGHTGSTILNLVVISSDVTKNVILIKGGIPGPNKSIVKIRSAVKDSKVKFSVKPLVNYQTSESK